MFKIKCQSRRLQRRRRLFDTDNNNNILESRCRPEAGAVCRHTRITRDITNVPMCVQAKLARALFASIRGSPVAAAVAAKLTARM